MKYIRTKDGKIIDIHDYWSTKAFEIEPDENYWVTEWLIRNGLRREDCKIADTIEELCDEFVLFYDNEETEPDLTYRGGFNDLYFQNELKHSAKCYGAIWTDKGLIYVAKMNDEGEWELI